MIRTKKDVNKEYDSSFAIEVKALKKVFKGRKAMPDVVAVKDISFQVEKGEVFGLLGPNGAGKSTTIGMLVGIVKPTDGAAYINGYDIEKEPQEAKQSVSVCPQDPAVFKFLTGLGNIKFFGNMYNMRKNDIISRSEELLKKLELFEVQNRLAKGYSGGMKRQLSLIMSLINEPDILFLDEPTVGMDPRNRRKVWDFLQEQKTADKTIILTTHYIEEAEALCDRVAIIDYGELIELGTPQDLIKKYEAKNLEDVFMKITGRSIMEGH